MSYDLLAWLIGATAATSFACIVIVTMRKPLQCWVGAEIAYRLWIAVPLAAIAACFALPHSTRIAAPTATAPIATSELPTLAVRVTQALSGFAADRWLLTPWILGMVALAWTFAWQQRRYVAHLRLRCADDGSWRSSAEGATPAVIGLFRQKLVLPEGFESAFSDAERGLVIAHERMHQRRRDPWALAVCALLRALFWFNPLVHVAAARFRRDVELACDAAVLRTHPRSRRRYAQALFKAELATGALPVGCRWHLTPPMKERIMLIKQAMPSRRARWLGSIVAVAVAGGVASVALAAHAGAVGVAAALAGGASAPQEYLVKLDMSVDGTTVAQPSVIVRAGDEAAVKVDDKGQPWGLHFHVAPATGTTSGAMRFASDVFTGDEKHVIARPQIRLMIGSPGVIELNDPQGATTRPIYRIAATVTPAAIAELPAPPPPSDMNAPMPPPPPPEAMRAPMPPPPPPAPPASSR